MSTDSPDNLITDPAELSIVKLACASFNSDLCESLLARVTMLLTRKGARSKNFLIA